MGLLEEVESARRATAAEDAAKAVALEAAWWRNTENGVRKLAGPDVALTRAGGGPGSTRRTLYVRTAPDRSHADGWAPEEVQLRLLLADGEIVLSRPDYNRKARYGSVPDAAWVRRCETCLTRWARDAIYLPCKLSPSREALIAALAEVTGPAECDFCTAAAMRATCPTCDRGWDS